MPCLCGTGTRATGDGDSELRDEGDDDEQFQAEYSIAMRYPSASKGKLIIQPMTVRFLPDELTGGRASQNLLGLFSTNPEKIYTFITNDCNIKTNTINNGD